jgi:hypothetical protein
VGAGGQIKGLGEPVLDCIQQLVEVRGQFVRLESTGIPVYFVEMQEIRIVFILNDIELQAAFFILYRSACIFQNGIDKFLPKFRFHLDFDNHGIHVNPPFAGFPADNRGGTIAGPNIE